MKVNIIKFDHFGRGIGKINDKIVFVPKALPNEIVDISVCKEKKNYYEGKIEKIMKYLMGLTAKNNELKWMKASFKTTDFFCHADTFFNNAKVLERYETIEIMCHPGHPAYEEETNMLFKFDFGEIQKISYKEL